MLHDEVSSGLAPEEDYAVEYRSGKTEKHGQGTPAFTIVVTDEPQLRRLLKGNAYSAALQFIRKQADITGDLVAALRLRRKLAATGLVQRLRALALRCAPARFETWFQSREQAAENIRFHYDLSNGFYQTFLDPRMVYSSGLFADSHWTLEQAQEARLEAICRDLDLHSGEQFLDIGCGWGALTTYAAARRNVYATGCTLSHAQYEFCRALVRERSLDQHVLVEERDYRDLPCTFDKIASIGMFEHVGRHRLAGYFRKVQALLKPGGLFVNSGIVRPQTVGDDPETWFLLRRVFPGGELAHLSTVVRAAEAAGFEILKVESLRKDYARTCREWVARLRRNRERCLNFVGEQVYRTWLLYLAASAANFDAGTTDVFSVLMTRS